MLLHNLHTFLILVDSGEQVLCISFANDLDGGHGLFIINVEFKDVYEFHH